MKTAAQIYGEIVRRVLAPAVASGPIVLGRPFGPRRARLAAEAFGESSAESIALTREIGEGIEQALVERVRRFSPMDAGALGSGLDGPTIALAAHLHDAMAAFHPDLAGLFRGSARTEVIELAIEAMVAMPPPSTVREALLRHAWLGTLPRFTLSRVDVSWWTGHDTFYGQEPPARLLAWPEVRKVVRAERKVPALRLPELFDARVSNALAEPFARALAAFFAASPLTDLAFAGRLAPPFTWTTATRTLVATKAGNRLARRVIASSEEGGRFAREAIAATRAPEAASITA